MTPISKLLLLLAAIFSFSVAASASPQPSFTLAELQPGYGQQGPGYGPGPGIRLTCSSNDGRRNFCNADTRGGVRMVRQISGSPCVQGRTWGFNRNAVWVDRGCRAEFILARGGQPQPPPFRLVTCSSNDGRRNWCAIGNRRNVRLSRQISGSPCIQGQTWDIDRRGLWVDRGCRAEFQVR